MKIRIIFLAIALTLSFGGYLAAESCSSCESHKVEETCADGSCASDGHEHKKEEAKPAAETKNEVEKNIPSINTAGLKTLIDSGAPVIVLDARSGKFDDGKRIPGALSLTSEAKSEEVAKVLPNKESLIVTYCSNTKCPASHKLFEHLKSLGYTNLIEYPEGIQGWVEAGNPVKEK
jgi:rhodanese-related sulfurtransferase